MKRYYLNRAKREVTFNANLLSKEFVVASIKEISDSGITGGWFKELMNWSVPISDIVTDEDGKRTFLEQSLTLFKPVGLISPLDMRHDFSKVSFLVQTNGNPSRWNVFTWSGQNLEFKDTLIDRKIALQMGYKLEALEKIN